jgi:uncharacterized protein (DUF1697 family)
MNTYIALFRGINVGGKNILPMKELVKYFEAEGCENIRSYVQSGNIVFQSKQKFDAKSATRIAQRVQKTKGFEPKILLLTPADLRTAVTHNLFPTTSGKALHFFFLESSASRSSMAQLESLKAGSEEFALRKKVFYLYAPAGIGRSKLAAGAEKALGVPVTARNWNTINKLVEMVDEL